VATGYYDKNNNSFQAFEILAKHDENYEPKEVVNALEGK
jgi:cytochrome c-type biogenesis protein CcmE